jgi:hypothetical protein
LQVPPFRTGPLCAAGPELGPKAAEQALFPGLDGEAVDLDGFAIRRGDLRAAIAALKKAGVPEL